MPKMNVLFDGNGGPVIRVVGLGDFIRFEAHNSALVAANAERDALAHRLNDVSIACKLSHEMLEKSAAERDALSAELAALSTFRDEVVGVMSQSQGVVGWHKNHQVALWDELFPVVPDFEAPRQHLAETRAEAGRVGYFAGFGEGWFSIYGPMPQDVENEASRLANEYAAKVRQGGAE